MLILTLLNSETSKGSYCDSVRTENSCYISQMTFFYSSRRFRIISFLLIESYRRAFSCACFAQTASTASFLERVSEEYLCRRKSSSFTSCEVFVLRVSNFSNFVFSWQSSSCILQISSLFSLTLQSSNVIALASSLQSSFAQLQSLTFYWY